MTAKLTISGSYFLMTWIFATSTHAFGVARSVEAAKTIIAEKLGVDLVWRDPEEGSSVHMATVNIRYGTDVLGGVLITPVAMYEVEAVNAG